MSELRFCLFQGMMFVKSLNEVVVALANVAYKLLSGSVLTTTTTATDCFALRPTFHWVWSPTSSIQGRLRSRRVLLPLTSLSCLPPFTILLDANPCSFSIKEQGTTRSYTLPSYPQLGLSRSCRLQLPLQPQRLPQLQVPAVKSPAHSVRIMMRRTGLPYSLICIFRVLTYWNSVVIKVGMVGDSQIGKTSLMVKYVEGSFDEDYIQTLGE